MTSFVDVYVMVKHHIEHLVLFYNGNIIILYQLGLISEKQFWSIFFTSLYKGINPIPGTLYVYVYIYSMSMNACMSFVKFQQQKMHPSQK